jgi:hypothetical protein
MTRDQSLNKLQFQDMYSAAKTTWVQDRAGPATFFNLTSEAIEQILSACWKTQQVED